MKTGTMWRKLNKFVNAIIPNGMVTFLVRYCSILTFYTLVVSVIMISKKLIIYMFFKLILPRQYRNISFKFIDLKILKVNI